MGDYDIIGTCFVIVIIFIFGFAVGTSLAVAYSPHCINEFDPSTDCQETWDMYPYLSETFDASHAVWAKLGLTDLKVEQFEYCMNHAPWGDYDGD